MAFEECQKKEYWLQDYERKVRYRQNKYLEKQFDRKPFKTINKLMEYLKKLRQEMFTIEFVEEEW